ncbi:MAG: ribosomal-protein-alanine N-acetyltransferase [Polaribacter sp.]|jgi:ribosomal-protein-alanine N-acetyltransferase
MAFNFTPFPVLETERFTLRALDLNDAKAIFGLRTNKEVNTYIKRTMLNNLSEARAFIDSISNSVANNTSIFWVLESKDTAELLGTVGLRNFDIEEDYAEIGYDMHPDFQENGYMSEAFKAILNFSAKQMDLKFIEAFTHKDNNASIALLEKYNFELQPDRKDVDFEDNRVYRLGF